jgi:hypothetical protein
MLAEPAIVEYSHLLANVRVALVRNSVRAFRIVEARTQTCCIASGLRRRLATPAQRSHPVVIDADSEVVRDTYWPDHQVGSVADHDNSRPRWSFRAVAAEQRDDAAWPARGLPCGCDFVECGHEGGSFGDSWPGAEKIH